MARCPRRGALRRHRRPQLQRISRPTLPHARPPQRGGRRSRDMTIPIKNKEGIAKMREACAIAATVLDQLKPLVRPGITTQDLEEAGRDFIARLGARSACYGYTHGSKRYPAHTCISVNDEVAPGF